MEGLETVGHCDVVKKKKKKVIVDRFSRREVKEKRAPSVEAAAPWRPQWGISEGEDGPQGREAKEGEIGCCQ